MYLHIWMQSFIDGLPCTCVNFKWCCHLGAATTPHSNTLAWKIPWTEEPGGLRRVGHGVHGVSKSRTWLKRLSSSSSSSSQSHMCLVTQLCLTLCDPMDCSLPGSSVHGDSLPCPYPGGFPTQGLIPGLLHCRRMLYCLRHQGSPSQYRFLDVNDFKLNLKVSSLVIIAIFHMLQATCSWWLRQVFLKKLSVWT